jgi:coenzyme F420-reducing hydrogenase delta subunit
MRTSFGPSFSKHLQEANKMSLLDNLVKQLGSEEEAKKYVELSHKLFCTGNHVDQCDWEYGNWDRPSYAHKSKVKLLETYLLNGGNKESLQALAKTKHELGSLVF